MTKYNDSDPLKIVEVGYNESTRILLFHSTPIEAEKLQEALDIIGGYNEFDSKKVGNILLEKFGTCKFIVGREFSPVVYVLPVERSLFWAEALNEVQEKGLVDEVAVTTQGTLRLWWD